MRTYEMRAFISVRAEDEEAAEQAMNTILDEIVGARPNDPVLVSLSLDDGEPYLADDLEDEEAGLVVCPRCGTSCKDTTEIADHGHCYDCHKRWQHGELPEQQEDKEV